LTRKAERKPVRKTEYWAECRFYNAAARHEKAAPLRTLPKQRDFFAFSFQK
jgi:hypothetical protein